MSPYTGRPRRNNTLARSTVLRRRVRREVFRARSGLRIAVRAECRTDEEIPRGPHGFRSERGEYPHDARLTFLRLPHVEELVRQAEETFVVFLLLDEVRDEANGARDDEKRIEEFRVDEFL